MKRKIVCGIDFGTTNSVVALITEAGDAEVVRVAGKDVVRPTVLYVDGDNVLIGEEAENAEALDPDRFIREPKRELGKTNDDGTPIVLFADPTTGKQWSVVDLTAEFLSQLKNFLESELDAEIVGGGLSHPAYFDDRARRQLKMAAEQAGLPV
ncbi:MAG: Hsp70 family protein, partial [Candidatus Omnitrophica bacterium]|nr:Hsp70 family protein [Candidatus Omnitrophota bacterium]